MIASLGGVIQAKKKQDVASAVYRALQGDVVDEMLAKYIN